MNDEKQPPVYIMANRYRGTMHVGVTSRLWTRVAEHKDNALEGFTQRYCLKRLVWYEHHHSMEDAIRREKLLKKWRRDWKFRIIEEMNGDWVDLHDRIDADATLVSPKARPRPSPG